MYKAWSLGYILRRLSGFILLFSQRPKKIYNFFFFSFCIYTERDNEVNIHIKILWTSVFELFKLKYIVFKSSRPSPSKKKKKSFNFCNRSLSSVLFFFFILSTSNSTSDSRSSILNNFKIVFTIGQLRLNVRCRSIVV